MGYGVESHHYDLVAGVFSESLREALEDDMDEQVAAAWDAVIRRIMDAMRAGIQ